MSLYSFRDPNITKTYKNFDIALKDVIDGNFTQQQIDESKLLVFQRVDRDPAPQEKGLASFTKGKTDE